MTEGHVAPRAVVNARVYTQDPKLPWAAGVLVEGGRVTRLLRPGDSPPPDIPLLDLGGRLVLPGFVDAHTHLLQYARSLDDVALGGVATLDEALSRVASVAATSSRRVLTGQGWDPHAWGGFPHRSHLDRAAPGRPVVLRSRDCHSVWLSSAALAEAGITAATDDPLGGRIERDGDGQPTGILLENATQLAHVLETADAAEVEERLERALREAVSLGLTGVHVFDGMEAFDALRTHESARGLPLRAVCYAAAGDIDDVTAAGLRSGYETGRVRLGGVKLFTDGALGSRTALLSEPYDGTSDDFGIAVLGDSELAELARRAAAGGLALAIHAIGDRANTRALDALAAAAAFDGGPARAGAATVKRGKAARAAGLAVPHRIEHAQLVFPADAARFGSLGVVASVQPCHIPGDWMAADRHWGDRSRYAYPFRTLSSEGAVLALGSDVPVEGWNPFRNLYAAVARRGWDGKPDGGWHPGEGLTLEEAIRAYTLGSAAASGEAGRRGTLSVGMDADFIVVSHDLFRTPPSSWLDARTEMTVVAGEVAYRTEDLEWRR